MEPATIQFNLRVPSDLKAKIEKASKDSGRSINAEAVYRLERSFISPNGLYDLSTSSDLSLLLDKQIMLVESLQNALKRYELAYALLNKEKEKPAE